MENPEKKNVKPWKQGLAMKKPLARSRRNQADPWLIRGPIALLGPKGKHCVKENRPLHGALRSPQNGIPSLGKAPRLELQVSGGSGPS